MDYSICRKYKSIRRLILKYKVMSTPVQQLQLINFLESFLPAVNSVIPTEINAGGCGIFAKHLLLNLKSLGLDDNFKIVYLIDKNKVKPLEYTIKNNKINDSHVGVQHCYVQINDFIFVDSEGIEVSPILATKNSKDMVSGEIPLEALQTIIDNIDSWNPIFDRDCEPAIERELSKMKPLFEDFQRTGVLDVTIQQSTRLTDYTVKTKRKRERESIFNFLR